MRQAAHLLAGLFLSALFLWLTLRIVDFAALRDAFMQVDLAMLALAPVALAFGYGARVQRWRVMLCLHNPRLGFGRAGVAFVAATAVNNLVPFRAGDALRCFAFGRWLGVTPGAVLGTVIVERVLDLVALMSIAAIAIWLLAPQQPGWPAIAVAAAAGAVIGLLVLWALIHPNLSVRFVRGLSRIAARLGPTAQSRVDALLLPLSAALSGLGARGQRGLILAWTVPVWVLEGACFAAVAHAVSGLIAPAAAWLALPMGTLATLLPTTPGHVGPFDYAAQLATTALGNPLVEATVFVLVVHAVLWTTTTATGLVCLLVWTTLTPGKAAS